MKELFSERIELLNKAWVSFPWEDPKSYAVYLAQTYYYVRHSCRLLAFSAGLSEFSSQGYFGRSIAHIKEEVGHENLAKADISNLGFNLENFYELGVTRALYESQYYKTQQQHPSALLGYIIALEGCAVNSVPLVFKRIEKSHSPKSMAFLKLHSDEDPDHLEKAFQQYEKLSFENKKFVEDNFVQTCQLFSMMLSQSAVEAKSFNMAGPEALSSASVA